MSSKVVAVRLPEKIYLAIEQLAKENDELTSETVRRLLRDLLHDSPALSPAPTPPPAPKKPLATLIPSPAVTKREPTAKQLEVRRKFTEAARARAKKPAPAEEEPIAGYSLSGKPIYGKFVDK